MNWVTRKATVEQKPSFREEAEMRAELERQAERPRNDEPLSGWAWLCILVVWGYLFAKFVASIR